VVVEFPLPSGGGSVRVLPLLPLREDRFVPTLPTCLCVTASSLKNAL